MPPPPNAIAHSTALARQGNLEAAIQGFTTAKQWDPTWPQDPKAYAEKIAAQSKK